MAKRLQCRMRRRRETGLPPSPPRSALSQCIGRRQPERQTSHRAAEERTIRVAPKRAASRGAGDENAPCGNALLKKKIRMSPRL